MRAAIILFDNFTDVDLFLMWDLLNRVKLPGWEVRILGDQPQHASATGLPVPTHGRIAEANEADVVLFVSGQVTRVKMKQQAWLAQFRPDPQKQLIGSICSGS